jgi:hypothetical protein
VQAPSTASLLGLADRAHIDESPWLVYPLAIGTYLQSGLGCLRCSGHSFLVRRGRVIFSASPTHREPIPLSLQALKLDIIRLGLRRGHVHHADAQVRALKREETGDNGTSSASRGAHSA